MTATVGTDLAALRPPTPSLLARTLASATNLGVNTVRAWAPPETPPMHLVTAKASGAGTAIELTDVRTQLELDELLSVTVPAELVTSAAHAAALVACVCNEDGDEFLLITATDGEGCMATRITLTRGRRGWQPELRTGLPLTGALAQEEVPWSLISAVRASRSLTAG